MLVDGDMMHSRMGLGGVGIASPTSAIPAISDFLKVILYLICTVCNLTDVYLESH